VDLQNLVEELFVKDKGNSREKTKGENYYFQRRRGLLTAEEGILGF